MKLETIVWYHIPSDEIFTAPDVDALFYALQPLKWEELMIVGLL